MSHNTPSYMPGNSHTELVRAFWRGPHAQEKVDAHLAITQNTMEEAADADMTASAGPTNADWSKGHDDLFNDLLPDLNVASTFAKEAFSSPATSNERTEEHESGGETHGSQAQSARMQHDDENGGWPTDKAIPLSSSHAARSSSMQPSSHAPAGVSMQTSAEKAPNSYAGTHAEVPGEVPTEPTTASMAEEAPGEIAPGSSADPARGPVVHAACAAATRGVSMVGNSAVVAAIPREGAGASKKSESTLHADVDFAKGGIHAQSSGGSVSPLSQQTTLTTPDAFAHSRTGVHRTACTPPTEVLGNGLGLEERQGHGKKRCVKCGHVHHHRSKCPGLSRPHTEPVTRAVKTASSVTNVESSRPPVSSYPLKAHEDQGVRAASSSLALLQAAASGSSRRLDAMAQGGRVRMASASQELLAAQGKNGMAGAAVVGPRLPMPERRRVVPFELAFGLQ